MWAEWLLPCIPNTCKITGATQRPFPTQRPYTLFFSSSFFSTSFLYQPSPVSTSFSLSVVDHLILWGLRLRVGNFLFFHRCSSFSQRVQFTLRGLFRFASTWLFASQSTFELTGLWSITLPPRQRHFDTLREDCVLFTRSLRSFQFSFTLICPLDHWTHLNVIQLETAS